MDIRPPHGYQEVVPLTRQHRVVLPETRKLPLVFGRLLDRRTGLPTARKS